MRTTGFALLLTLTGAALPPVTHAQSTTGFCAAARKHVEGDTMLLAAVSAVFRHPRYSVQSGQDVPCIYPLPVLEYASAEVLLTIGNEPGRACHSCSASLSAYFLARRRDGIHFVNKAVDFTISGLFGEPGNVVPVPVGPDDGIAIESGGTFDGHTSSALQVYAFRHGRVLAIGATPPILLSTFGPKAAASREPVIDVMGIWTVKRGPPGSVSVDYRASYGALKGTGSAVWTLFGDRWRLTSGRVPPELLRDPR